MADAIDCDYCHLPMPRASRRKRDKASAGPHAEPPYCCYGCSLAARITQARGEKGAASWMLARLGVSVFLSMGVMVFSLALYSPDVYGIGLADASPLARSLTGLLRYLLLILATPVFLLLGVPVLNNASRQMRSGVVSTDALVVLGVAAAFVYSYISTMTDQGKVYYETACMILVFITLGRYLEANGKLQASQAVESLERLIPDEVTIRRGGVELTVARGDVRVGDVLVVVAGGRVAVDGMIVAGRANVDEKILTGESRPVVRGPGDAVHAGTVNLDGALTVRATGVGSDSALGRLMAQLDKAKHSKGRFERLADRVATFFVPIVVALAGLGAILGFRRGSGDEALMTALAVLLISCPCALGIATSMAIWVSLGRAATLGILFRNGETLEALARVGAVAFDKTGTLTTGEPTVASFVAHLEGHVGTDTPDEHVIALAAGLGGGSTHALAQSIVTYAGSRRITPEPVRDVRTLPGRGLIGTIDGATVRLGSVAMMEEAGVGLNGEMSKELDRIAAADQGIVCVGVGDRLSGVFAFSETLRIEARAALTELQRQGCAVAVLTGDHARRGEAIADMLSVETLAELTPQQKVNHIERLHREVAAVAMVGDGLNDAPALAAADVGIAMGCGADVTRESADICLLGDDLATLPIAFQLARRTVRTIKINLFWAFLYNSIGVGLALSGRLNPTFAAAAMVLSSLFVVTNSLRLNRAQLASQPTAW